MTGFFIFLFSNLGWTCSLLYNASIQTPILSGGTVPFSQITVVAHTEHDSDDDLQLRLKGPDGRVIATELKSTRSNFRPIPSFGSINDYYLYEPVESLQVGALYTIELFERDYDGEMALVDGLAFRPAPPSAAQQTFDWKQMPVKVNYYGLNERLVDSTSCGLMVGGIPADEDFIADGQDIYGWKPLRMKPHYQVVLHLPPVDLQQLLEVELSDSESGKVIYSSMTQYVYRDAEGNPWPIEFNLLPEGKPFIKNYRLKVRHPSGESLIAETSIRIDFNEDDSVISVSPGTVVIPPEPPVGIAAQGGCSLQARPTDGGGSIWLAWILPLAVLARLRRPA